MLRLLQGFFCDAIRLPTLTIVTSFLHVTDRRTEDGWCVLLGYSEQGDLLNINADYLARAVAISLGAKKLILMTDVKGILENGRVLNHLNIVDVQKKIDSGVITGGMIPKIQSAVQTVQAGVEQVVIGDNLTDGTIIKE